MGYISICGDSSVTTFCRYQYVTTSGRKANLNVIFVSPHIPSLWLALQTMRDEKLSKNIRSIVKPNFPKRRRKPASIQAVREAIDQFDKAAMWRYECLCRQIEEIVLAREALEATA